MMINTVEEKSEVIHLTFQKDNEMIHTSEKILPDIAESEIYSERNMRIFVIVTARMLSKEEEVLCNYACAVPCETLSRGDIVMVMFER